LLPDRAAVDVLGAVNRGWADRWGLACTTAGWPCSWCNIDGDGNGSDTPEDATHGSIVPEYAGAAARRSASIAAISA
jgi:hypothetical protein